ncbi:MAG: efflux RND transporter periplasmic adaptor subunit, partial [Flammeovirgaceae bacterium]|nr:efflux RND transporter periplasmic adaptor subunit [Flammeovirgaceae bacterium]MDW8287654.1 efflux RND transporter periplasmic adaptor subunit [Flammeovirgaceae bacterium]
VVVALLAKNFSQQKKEEPSTESSPAATQKPRATVKTLVVKKSSLEEKIQTRGTLLPNESITIVSEQAGIVRKIHFNEGAFVRKGEVLVSLDDSEWQAQLKRAESELNYLVKKEQLDRKLLEKDGVSLLEYEQVVRDLNMKKADIELLQVRIDKTRIVAPFSGIVGFRQVSEGSYVSPATPITQLVDISSLKIDFSVPEKYMHIVRIGADIFFKVEGIEETLRGTVYAIDPQIDTNTRTIRLRAISRNTSKQLLVGAFANVEIIIQKIPDTIAIPSEAVIPEINGKKVFVVRSGKAKSVNIETGIRTATHVQVVRGLQLGDTLITSGIMNLREGIDLQITWIAN